jgi:hypothetical protein
MSQLEDQLLNNLYVDHDLPRSSGESDPVSTAWLAARDLVAEALPAIKAQAICETLVELERAARLDDDPFIEPKGKVCRHWWRLGWLSANAVSREVIETVIETLAGPERLCPVGCGCRLGSTDGARTGCFCNGPCAADRGPQPAQPDPPTTSYQCDHFSGGRRCGNRLKHPGYCHLHRAEGEGNDV